MDVPGQIRQQERVLPGWSPLVRPPPRQNLLCPLLMALSKTSPSFYFEQSSCGEGGLPLQGAALVKEVGGCLVMKGCCCGFKEASGVRKVESERRRRAAEGLENDGEAEEKGGCLLSLGLPKEKREEGGGCSAGRNDGRWCISAVFFLAWSMYGLT